MTEKSKDFIILADNTVCFVEDAKKYKDIDKKEVK